MSDNMGGNKAGRYEVVRNKKGMSDSGSRLYYQTYIPADLSQVDDASFVSDELSGKLNTIYREIGRQQGLCFYESNYELKNRQFYKQELVAFLESKGTLTELTDVFGSRMSDDISKRVDFYDGMLQKGDAELEDLLLGTVKIQKKNCPFRKTQIWEETNIRRISLREHNPPAPERVLDLMISMDSYRREKHGTDIIVQAALLCYQFLTIMPYEEDNEIWASILLNLFLREQGCGLKYYIPFAKYFLEENEDRKQLMKQVREDADYSSWIWFFLKVMTDALAKTNQTIMQLEEIHKETLVAIGDEKQKALLTEILAFMEDSPIFVIADIEKAFHIAYNTAAKMVSILEKHGVVKEISNKQRYRIYSYDKYIREMVRQI